MSKKNNKILSIDCPKMHKLIKKDISSRIKAASATNLNSLHFEPSQLPSVPISVNAVVAGKQVCLQLNLNLSRSEASYKIDFPDTIPDQEINVWLDECGNKLQKLIFQELN